MDKSEWIDAFVTATHRFVEDHESAVRALGEALWVQYGDIDPGTVARGNFEARALAGLSAKAPSAD